MVGGSWFRWAAGAAFSVLAALMLGCPKKTVEPAPPPPAAPAITDFPALQSALREAGARVRRADAGLQVAVEGLSGPYRGRFFGSLRLERRTEEEAGMALQVYTLPGVPVLEFIAQGERMELFLPLERTIYFNFTQLLPPDTAFSELALSSFAEVNLPLSLIMEQVKLIWGQGFSGRYRYQFSPAELSYVVREWDGDELRRQIEYSRDGLFLRLVMIYWKGEMTGRVVLSENGPADKPESLIPRRIEILQGEVKVSLKLDGVRVNEAVTGAEIAFRPPSPDQRLILLTPPVP